MENIFYEYKHDRSPKIQAFKGQSTNAPRHFHRNIEVIYVISGEIETSVGDESFTAKADNIIFVHNYYIHSYKPKSKYKKLVLIIPSNYGNDIDKVMNESTLPPLLSDAEYNRKNILPHFEKIVEENDTLPPLVKKGFLNVLIGLLFAHYPPLPIKTPGNIEFMVEVLHYIDEHYKEPLTLDSIAATFGYNKYYFSRIFNKYIGENLANYINVVRVRNFMDISKGYKKPQIAKLAFECGFDSLPTFYRSFMKIYGESPKASFSKKQ